MSEPGYPAARAVAPRIQAHFHRHLAGRPASDSSYTAPEVADIEAIIDAAFWASLRREEGFSPKISLALVPPERSDRPLLFDRPLPLRPQALVRVAPAVERPGIHLGVWRDREGLRVWGTTRVIPPVSFVLEVSAPGLLVVKHHRGDGGKFVNVAVLEGDQIKMIDERASALPDCPGVVSSLLGFEALASEGRADVAVELAVSMRAHGRGGIILMVPTGTNQWRESVVHPMPYAVVPPYQALAELINDREKFAPTTWEDELDDAVRAIAGLSAVDGATVLTDRCALLAFGAKIARREGWPLVEEVSVTEPIEQASPAVMHPSRIGGTRHLSAAQFVHDQRDAVALVASQDGRFTVFAWSPCEARVHAHRVEALLL